MLTSTLFPYTTLFRSEQDVLTVGGGPVQVGDDRDRERDPSGPLRRPLVVLDHETDRIQLAAQVRPGDRKSTRLNSSHVAISYAVFCLKKKKSTRQQAR